MYSCKRLGRFISAQKSPIRLTGFENRPPSQTEVKKIHETCTFSLCRKQLADKIKASVFLVALKGMLVYRAYTGTQKTSPFLVVLSKHK